MGRKESYQTNKQFSCEYFFCNLVPRALKKYKCGLRRVDIIQSDVLQKVQVGIWAYQRLRSAYAFARNLIRVFDGHCMGSQGSIVSSGGKLRLWSDCVGAHTDLNLRCTHMPT